ncbi:UDP-glucose/GDP-mannose dehydrogenase family protein [Gammaproteobacteria bacterium]|nr:UDP-glucose/GDP-mannose dehydrogenase family protein [Gammaproteobacteria bacterium]
MKITVIGTGYVGLVSAVCFSNAGHDVLCLDLDKKKIEKLRNGEPTIYEPGLEELLVNSIENGKIHFTTDVNESVQYGNFQFICVGTPQSNDGSANLDFYFDALKNIAQYMKDEKIIVNKSTVPIGTIKDAKRTIIEVFQERGEDVPFELVSNPEFLREGCAIDDFIYPDRVIIGTENQETFERMMTLYKQVNIPEEKIISMRPASAELTKYSANGFLATKISFINEIANLAEKVGADIKEVELGMGKDHRIGEHFLNAGCGYGGSCFPKDIDALLYMSEMMHGQKLRLLDSVKQVNIHQKDILFDKLYKYFDGNVENKRIAIWGLSFKPNTDDMRESPSIVLLKKLVNSGAKVIAHDPQAIQECKSLINDERIEYTHSIDETVVDADAIVLVTDWNIYKTQDFLMHSKHMKRKLIIDGRNCLSIDKLIDMGFEYCSIGRV